MNTKNYDFIQLDHNLTKYKDYAYWYGGKGQKASQELLTALSKQYPKVYTQTYINKCKKDIEANKSVIDCSGYVCKVLEIEQLGSWQILKKFEQLKHTGEPKNGDIVYRKGHVGIYYFGQVYQFKGIDYDFYIEPYKKEEWTYILATNTKLLAYEEYAKTGWIMTSEGKWWYAYDKKIGSYYKDEHVWIDDKFCYFDPHGYLVSETKYYR